MRRGPLSEKRDKKEKASFLVLLAWGWGSVSLVVADDRVQGGGTSLLQQSKKSLLATSNVIDMNEGRGDTGEGEGREDPGMSRESTFTGVAFSLLFR